MAAKNPRLTQGAHILRRAGFILVLLGVFVFPALFLSGCGDEKEPDKGANQSLVEIGEHSLELAEDFEGRGRMTDANVEYKRALWAFRYHQRLTGEEPFLLDDALDGVERTDGQR